MPSLIEYEVAEGVSCAAIEASETDESVTLIVFSDNPKVNPNYPIPVFLVTVAKERKTPVAQKAKVTPDTNVRG